MTQNGKAVLGFSIMHHGADTAGDAGKPKIILYYNEKNDGVNKMDNLTTIFPAREKQIDSPWFFSTICWMFLQL